MMQPKMTTHKKFAEEFAERRAAGDCQLYAWTPDKPNASAQYEADFALAHWLHYFDMRGEHQTARVWRYLARTAEPGQGVSLPHMLPDVWGQGYDLPRNPWHTYPSEQWKETRRGKHASEQTLDERRATVEEAMIEVRKAARHMEMFPNEPRRKDQPAPVVTKSLDDLKREATENPVKMSPGLAARLGISRGDEPAPVER